MEGSVLSFLKAESKVSDTGSTHCLPLSFYFCCYFLCMQISHFPGIIEPSNETLLQDTTYNRTKNHRM
jgi:hypothetical protein